MTDDLFPLAAGELARIENATLAFCDLWARIKPPWPHNFDGTYEDVRAIDYLDYEGVAFPDCGIEGAALVCGEVLRRAANLQWKSDYCGDWYITSSYGIAICPVTRVHEFFYAGIPQFGKFLWFVSQAALDCLRFIDSEHQQILYGFILENEDFVHGLDLTLKALQLRQR